MRSYGIQTGVTWTCLVGINAVRAREAEARTWMFDGDGAILRKPVHDGKDLRPGIIGQLGGE